VLVDTGRLRYFDLIATGRARRGSAHQIAHPDVSTRMPWASVRGRQEESDLNCSPLWTSLRSPGSDANWSDAQRSARTPASGRVARSVETP
jgi:hypothetical protein